MEDKKKILIIIPAYNEGKNIKSVYDAVLKSPLGLDILVINDCSTDNTGEILSSNKINHVSLPINLGIGGAMQTGYKYAFENGYDFAIQVDGDGQHKPEEIQKLLAVQEKTKADLVIGSRFSAKTNYKQKLMRMIGIKMLSFVTVMLTRQRISDVTSGFRLANREVIHLFTNYYPTDYPEPEVIIYLKNKGLIIEETPVGMEQRLEGKSSITPLKSAYYMIKVISSMLIQKVRSL